MRSLFIIALLTISTSAAAAPVRTVCDRNTLGEVECFVLTVDPSRTSQWNVVKAHWMPVCIAQKVMGMQAFGDVFEECQDEFASQQQAFSRAGVEADEFLDVMTERVEATQRCIAEHEESHPHEIPSQAKTACKFRMDVLQERWLASQAAAR